VTWTRRLSGHAVGSGSGGGGAATILIWGIGDSFGIISGLLRASGAGFHDF
jgi:hypothetical protein